MGGTGVTVCVFVQVELVISFGVVEGLQAFDDGDNGCVLVPLLLHVVSDVPGNGVLLRIQRENPTPVLGADVRALCICGGWVVDSEEKLHQLLEGDGGRLVRNEHRFGKLGFARAHLLVRGTMDGVVPVGVTHSHVNKLGWNGKVLAEDVFHSPETARRKNGVLGGLGLLGS